jgi:hypothetical protein
MKQNKFSISSGLQNKKIENMSELKPSSVNHFEVEFDGTMIKVDLAQELSIDENNLVSAMTTHAGNYGWWAGLNSTAKRLLRNMDQKKHETVAGLDVQARASLQAQGIKVTEAGVSAYIASDPRSAKYTEEMTMLKDIVEFTDSVLKGLEHKREMLREINRAQLGERYSERH